MVELNSQGLSAGLTSFDEYTFGNGYSAQCVVIQGAGTCRADFTRSAGLYSYYRYTCVQN